MLNAITYSHLIRMLMDGDHTRASLARGTGLHAETVSRYVNQLHRRRAVCIVEWERNPVNGNWCPVYTLNVEDLEDVPKPAPKPKSEIDREYRARQKYMKFNNAIAGRF